MTKLYVPCNHIWEWKDYSCCQRKTCIKCNKILMGESRPLRKIETKPVIHKPDFSVKSYNPIIHRPDRLVLPEMNRADVRNYPMTGRGTFRGKFRGMYRGMVGVGVAAGGGGVTISDDFNRANNLDNWGASWTTDVGEVNIVSNQGQFTTAGWDPIAVHHVTPTNTVNQYVKVTFPLGGGDTYPVIMFRYTNTTTHFYGLQFEDLTLADMRWRHYAGTAEIGGGTEIQGIDLVTGFSNGTVIGITLTGTGADTTIRVWVNPTGNAPTSATNWGGDTTPDASFTTDPGANNVDTGNLVGFAGAQDSAGNIVFDDFYAGDIP